MKRLILGILVAAFLTTPASADTGKLRLYHVVKSGDTLSGIAHHYGATIATLTKLNKLKDHRIKIGGLLEVPWPSAKLRNATKIQVIRHQVLPGETLGAIAIRYGSDARSIKLLNKLPSFKIKIGGYLDVPTTGSTVQRVDFTYAVRPGDTIHVLAVKFRVLHRVIRYLNPGVNFKKLKQGQEIRMIRFKRLADTIPAKRKPAVKPKAKIKVAAKVPTKPAKKIKVPVNRAPKTLIEPTPAPKATPKQTPKKAKLKKAPVNKAVVSPNYKPVKKS